MPAQANANVVALQLEKVRDKVPLLYERDDILLTMIQQRMPPPTRSKTWSAQPFAANSNPRDDAGPSLRAAVTHRFND